MNYQDDSLAKRNVAVLVAAQAFLGSQITMVFVIGGLAGQQLAPNVCLATLPITMIVFGSMTTAPWLSPLMQKHGAGSGFMLAPSAGYWERRFRLMRSRLQTSGFFSWDVT